MRLAVVGTGLIGGSFALAARDSGLFDEVVGIDPDQASAEQARELGVIDRVATAVPDDAAAVLLASPCHTLAPWIVRLAEHPGIVFDAGSVKSAVLDQVRAELGALPPRYVPCHPLAGSERSGPQAADPALFRDAEVVLTPTDETSQDAVAQVTGWWHTLGARVCLMSAAEHDATLAVTSHLPHLVAFAYLQHVTDAQLAHGASGFRDFTRIGAADADMWAPIFRLNQTAVLAALDDLEAALAEARTLVTGADGEALAAFMGRAAARRRRFPGG